MEAGSGVLRFVFAGPEDASACRAVLHAVVEEAQARPCPELLALLPQYGPIFHDPDWRCP